MTMSRRQLLQGAGLAGLGLLAGCGRWPGQAPSPAPVERVYRLGYLSAAAPPPQAIMVPPLDYFKQALRDLGYVEGRNLAVESRYIAESEEPPSALADELVALPVDVIVTSGIGATRWAARATSTIPIVQMTGGGDMVGMGLVASHRRPGGNITGLNHLEWQLTGKRLQLLQEAVPGLSRVALLWQVDLSIAPMQVTELEAATRLMGLEYHYMAARTAADLDDAFTAAVQERATGLLVISTPLTVTHGRRIVDLAAEHRLPAVYEARRWAALGGLMAYGTTTVGSYERAATYVDRILKGANPADLPVEQPTTFEFAINLQTAQALGLTIPQHVLLQATEVIQ
jgi:putative tryptophan/tyrosine transport system substrate-binding protein